MVSYTEGKEISVSDSADWTSVTPVAGWVIEVFVAESSLVTLSDSWAAFLIMKAETEEDGSHVLSVKFLGAEDEDATQDLTTKFFRGGKIHMCLSKPCIEVRPMEALHVTRVKFWTWDTFKDNADYLIAGIMRSVTRWRKEIREADEKEAEAPKGPRGVAAPKKVPAKTKEVPEVAKGGTTKANVGSGLTDEMRKKLRSKLGDIKRRVRDAGGPLDEEQRETGPGAEDGKSADEDTGYVPTSPEEGGVMTTGTAMVPLGKTLGKPERTKKVAVVKEAVSSDIGTKSLSGQLIQRAMTMTKLRKAKAKKKKAKKGKKEQVVKLLSQILTGGSKKDRGKKDKKKKRRMLRDGVIESCSTSSGESMTGDTDSGDSEDDLEAPMKKKSRDRPGSVLAMLTEHIRSVMEQAATADLQPDEVGVTGGIKVASYFQMHVKPQYLQYQRELREMHSLAATLDLLRMGDVARVGDSLSARFMALHQSMIDQGWSTARHMELHNMDDTSAASAGMILASRKHSRLVEKVQGKGWYSGWGGRGKGRGKHDWKGGQDDYKGEKGKGKKGKKNGKWQGGGQWDKKVSEWDKSKEKADEK